MRPSGPPYSCPALRRSFAALLPDVPVPLGAEATLRDLMSTVPQLMRLSAHKALVFGMAATLLMASRRVKGQDTQARNFRCVRGLNASRQQLGE